MGGLETSVGAPIALASSSRLYEHKCVCGGGGGVGGVDRWLSGGRINHNTCGYKQRLGRVLNSEKV